MVSPDGTTSRHTMVHMVSKSKSKNRGRYDEHGADGDDCGSFSCSSKAGESTVELSKEDAGETSIEKRGPNETDVHPGPASGDKTKTCTSRDDATCSDWESMFQRLLEFKRKFGHVLVPSTWKKDPSLAAWVFKMKRQDPNQVVETADRIKSCGQKQRRKKTSVQGLTPRRIELLESVGFVWEQNQEPKRVSWQTRFDQLVEFKKEHGHVMVPIRYLENVKLAHWVSTQRQEGKWLREGKPSRLTREKVKLLDSIGFAWVAPRGVSDQLKRMRKGEEKPAPYSFHEEQQKQNHGDKTTTRNKKKRRICESEVPGAATEEDAAHDSSSSLADRPSSDVGRSAAERRGIVPSGCPPVLPSQETSTTSSESTRSPVAQSVSTVQDHESRRDVPTMPSESESCAIATAASVPPHSNAIHRSQQEVLIAQSIQIIQQQSQLNRAIALLKTQQNDIRQLSLGNSLPGTAALNPLLAPGSAFSTDIGRPFYSRGVDMRSTLGLHSAAQGQLENFRTISGQLFPNSLPARESYQGIVQATAPVVPTVTLGSTTIAPSSQTRELIDSNQASPADPIEDLKLRPCRTGPNSLLPHDEIGCPVLNNSQRLSSRSNSSDINRSSSPQTTTSMHIDGNDDYHTSFLAQRPDDYHDGAISERRPTATVGEGASTMQKIYDRLVTRRLRLRGRSLGRL